MGASGNFVTSLSRDTARPTH